MVFLTSLLKSSLYILVISDFTLLVSLVRNLHIRIFATVVSSQAPQVTLLTRLYFFFPESLCKPLSYLRISLNHFILFFVEASVWQFYYLRKQSYKTFIISTVRIPVTPFYIPMTRTTVLSTYIDKVVYPYTIVEFLDHPTRLLSVSKAVCVLWIWMTANLEGTRAIWSSFISPF